MSERFVYVVDDDRSIRASLEILLPLMQECTPISFENGDAFVAKAEELEPGCLLLDLRMPGRGGIEVLDAIQSMPGRFVPIMMSGHGEIADAVSAMKLGAFDFIAKERQFHNLGPILESAF